MKKEISVQIFKNKIKYQRHTFKSLYVVLLESKIVYKAKKKICIMVKYRMKTKLNSILLNLTVIKIIIK